MHLEDLHGLFVHELKDLYSAENQILDEIADVIEGVTHQGLRRALAVHLEETRNQIDALEQIFRDLGEDPTGLRCKGMEGLLRQTKELLAADMDATVRDAALIGAVQRIEHYEIACYGTVVTYARMLGHGAALQSLEELLAEEKDADAVLSDLAENAVNVQALG